MNEILVFLTTHMRFLWRKDRFKFEKSIGGEGNAGIYLVSDSIRIFMVRDKGQLFLDMQPASSRSRTEWYSIDLVYQSITGAESRQTSLLDAEYARFIELRLDEIEERFSADRWKNERLRLREFAKERSKRMFPGRPL